MEQAELERLGVEPNVEDQLDRVFARINDLYGGDIEAFFRDAGATNAQGASAQRVNGKPLPPLLPISRCDEE